MEDKKEVKPDKTVYVKIKNGEKLIEMGKLVQNHEYRVLGYNDGEIMYTKI